MGMQEFKQSAQGMADRLLPSNSPQPKDIPRKGDVSYFGSPFQQIKQAGPSMTPMSRLGAFGAGAFNAVATPEQKAAYGGVGDYMVGEAKRLAMDVDRASAPDIAGLKTDVAAQAASPGSIRGDRGEIAPQRLAPAPPAPPARRQYQPGSGITQTDQPTPFGRIMRR